MSLEAYTKSNPEVYTGFNSYKAVRTDGTLIPGSQSSIYAYGGRSLSGYRNPSFRSQIKNGIAATTPMNAVSNQLTEFVPPKYSSDDPFAAWPSGVKHIDESFGGDFISQLGAVQVPNTSLASTVASMAYQKFYSQASSFNGLTVLGELKETVHMMRNPASALRNAVGAYLKNAKLLRSSKIASARTLKAAQRDYRKAISGSWLEYNFGWKPFVNDLGSLLDSYNKSQLDPTLETVRVSQTLEGSAPEIFIAGLAVHGGSSGVYRSSKYSSGMSITAGIKSRVSTSSGVLATFGLLPENFVPTAWELCPWSFLIDYFVNIGGVLDSWATAQRLEFGFCSVTSRNLTTYKFRTFLYENTNITSIQEGAMTFEVKTVSRSSPGNVPLPSFQSQIKLSDSRLLNIGALLNERGADLAFRARKR